MVKDYIKIYYSNKLKPITDYPFKLVSFLIKKNDIKPGMNVLDLGCGRGDYIIPFKQLGMNVYGVDISEYSINYLKNNGYNVCYCDFEKNKIPFEKNFFDVIFSKSVIEHLGNPENYFEEIKRILKPNGKLIILTPDWYSQYKIFYNDYTHKQPYTIESLQNILINYNFNDIKVSYFYQLPIIWKFPFLKFISCLIRWLWPKHIKSKIKFIRFSVELMLLATANNNKN